MLGAYIVVLITASSEESENIARRLLEERLAACVNIVRGIKSLFWWEGKIDEAQEALLIAKTRLDQMEKLIQAVKQIHSYSVPEIIALPIIARNMSYLTWISQNVRKPEST
ncbi:MAG: divalent-cation tolerance protein CutA [Thaumarchaeota archaeon]|nr:divalent-cation tolerance protein CutA [Nitrososphaerota archaeon]